MNEVSRGQKIPSHPLSDTSQAERQNPPTMKTEGEVPGEEAEEKLLHRLGDVDARMRQFVGEKPLVAIASAVIVGFVAGRLLSRA